MRLTTRLAPVARSRDVQVALILQTLLHRPFTDAEDVAPVLQRTTSEAAEALETAARCVLDAQPVIEPHKDVWILSAVTRKAVGRTKVETSAFKWRGVLWYVSPGVDEAARIITMWLDRHDRITSGDFAAITGMTMTGARGALERYEGDLLERGDGAGRNAHFILRR